MKFTTQVHIIFNCIWQKWEETDKSCINIKLIYWSIIYLIFSCSKSRLTIAIADAAHLLDYLFRWWCFVGVSLFISNQLSIQLPQKCCSWFANHKAPATTEIWLLLSLLLLLLLQVTAGGVAAAYFGFAGGGWVVGWLAEWSSEWSGKYQIAA